MTLKTDNFFPEIAGRAATFRERITGDFAFVEGAADPEKVGERLELWRRVSAAGEADRFAKRLSWDGLTIQTAERLLGKWRPKNGSLPEWTATLKSVLDRYDERSTPSDPSPRSFEDFLLPFADEYWDRLNSLTNGLSLLTRSAADQLKIQFLQKAVLGAAPTLLRELSLRKAVGGGALDDIFRQPDDKPSRKHYDAMMDHLQGVGLCEFFMDYPVLARLLCQWTVQSAEAMAECLTRLQADYDDLLSHFGMEGRLKVKSLNADLSDPHDHGRGVVRFVFEDDTAIVYKPRGAGLWRAWDGLLDWMNDRRPPLPLYRIRQLPRNPYLWQEFVDNAPCRTPDDVRSYYRRVGHLMAVLHVLRGGDIHHENIIAHGDYPVLVDVEMLLQGLKRHRQTHSILKTVHDQVCETFCGSVLDTGLLPIWMDAGAGEERDHGGAGGMVNRGRRSVFKNAGTDDMTLEYEDYTEDLRNTVRLKDRTVGLLEGRDDLLAGFLEMGRWLAEQKTAWLAPDGPLARLAGQPVRYLLRNTENYAIVHRLMLDVDCLRDGVDFGLRLESMADRWTQEESGRDVWPLYREELESLERLDIPLFSAIPSERNVFTLAGAEVSLFEKSGVERARASMENLDEDKIAFQMEIARKAINSHADMRDITDYKLPPPLRLNDTASPLPPSAAVDRARQIALDIRAKRQKINGGSWWIEPAYDDEMRRMKLTVLNNELYNGAPGMALFLAAYGHVTGDCTFRPLVYEALEKLRPYLKEKDTTRQLARELGVGGILGSGGLIYSFVRCGEWMNDPALIEEANNLASALDRAIIDRDKKLDIISGSAGTILALLALDQARPRGPALSAARLCGEKILSARRTWKDELLAWVDEKYTVPITGFSHGAAGMSYALWRLFAATGDDRFAQGAREGVAFESRLYVAEKNYWKGSPDEEFNKRMGLWTTWCHGSPGIGLSRLGMLAMGPESQRDALSAIEALKTVPEHPCDHLCCGNFGRLELLLAAGEKLKRDDFIVAARAGAAQLLSERKGIDFHFNPHLPPGPISPTLFVGTAGIGYELLRMSFPEKLPSVLLLQ